MIRRTAIYSALSASLLATPVLAADSQGTSRALAGSPGATTQKEAIVYLVVKRKSIEGRFPWERIEVPESEVEERIHELLSDPDVLHVERDQLLEAPKPVPEPAFAMMSAYVNQVADGLLYNDPEFHQQVIFQAHENGTDMRLLDAHKRLNSDRKVRVGVLDTGFYLSNDFEYSEGYNLYLPGGPEFLNGSGGLCSDVQSPSDHGVRVASVLAATPDNGIGIVGAAPSVELVAGRIADCQTRTSSYDVTLGILWMAGETFPFYGDLVVPVIESVEVINVSYGFSASGNSCASFLQDAIDVAAQKGISVVFSAGNNGGDADDHPQNLCDGSISVAATTPEGTLSDFSNSGATVNIAATGERVRTLGPGDIPVDARGTSFSAPVVAGALALVKAERPHMTPADFKEALRHSGNPATDGATGIGGGILNVMKLMDQAGIPRVRDAGAHALSGHREAYAEALTHPRAQAYLSSTGTALVGNLCEAVEVDAQAIESPDLSSPVTLFRVATGYPLVPTNDNVIDQSTGSRMIAPMPSASDLNLWEYGVAQCDLENEGACSVARGTVAGISPERLAVPQVCLVAGL